MHLLTIKSARAGKEDAYRQTFIYQTKQAVRCGRKDWLYLQSKTTGIFICNLSDGRSNTEFWKHLARENQLDFKASGSAGKCIEGREFIIALPESFVQYRAEDVVRLLRKLFIENMVWSAAQPFIITRQRQIIISIWYSANGKCWNRLK